MDDASEEVGARHSEEEAAALVEDSAEERDDVEQGAPAADERAALSTRNGPCDLEVPEGGGLLGKLLFGAMLPWALAFRCTVPDCSRDAWKDWCTLRTL